MFKFPLDRIFRSNPLNNPVNYNEMGINSFLEMMGGQNKSDSGEIVNPHTAMHTSTVWACISLITQQIATNPFNMYKLDGKGNKDLATDHDYFDLVANRPNDEQDSISFRTAVETSRLLHGNAYIEIQRDGAGRAVALWQRNSLHTNPFRTAGGTWGFVTMDTPDHTERFILNENMIHILGMTYDGRIGLSPIAFQRQSLGKKIAMDKYSGRFFANNATPQLALITKNIVKAEDKAKMRQDWETLQRGSNQHRVAILDQDMTLEKMSISNNDSQFMESMNATEKEIAAWFGIPGYVIGLLDKGIKANVEQQNQDLYNLCLKPIIAKYEKAFTNKLFNNRGRSAGRYACQFDMFGFLHPDSGTLVTSNQSSIQNGVITPNEARARLGLNGIGPVGDVHYIQLNMQSLELANSTTIVDDKPDTELALEQETNSLPKRLGQSYRSLFKIGVGRIIKTPACDHKAVYRHLWPVVDALAQATRATIKVEQHEEMDKAVDKFLQGIERRASKWVPEDIEQICTDEMKKVAKTLIFAARADEGISKAKKDYDQLTTDNEAELDALATGD